MGQHSLWCQISSTGFPTSIKHLDLAGTSLGKRKGVGEIRVGANLEGRWVGRIQVLPPASGEINLDPDNQINVSFTWNLSK